MIDNDFKAAIDMINRADSIVVISHVNPDGDALGSMVGFAAAALQSGKKISLCAQQNIAGRCDFVTNGMHFEPAENFPALAKQADAIVVVDTNSTNQLGDFAQVVSQHKSKTCIFDHHLTSDNLGAVNFTDHTASAAGLIVLELLQMLGWSINEKSRDSLAVAMLTDTGWLRFSNADSRTLRAIAYLVDQGAKLSEISDAISNNLRIEKLRLTQRALASIELFFEGKLSIMTLTLDDFAQTGATEDETEAIVNQAMQVATVESSVIIVQTPEVNRVSLRSRKFVDVAAIARGLGGGGHARAAGCKVAGSPEQVKQKIVELYREKLGG